MARDVTTQRHPAIQLRWMAFGAMSLFFLFEFVARIEPSLAAIEITAYFGLSNAGFGTLSSLFFWVYAPMQIVVGILLDRFGLRRLVIPATLVCSLGVFTFAFTPVPVIGGVGRIATGLGASFAFVGALYVVNHYFDSNRFALLSGTVNAIGMIGTAFGAVALTSAIEQLGWRSVFLGTGTFGLVVFALAFAFVKDHPGVEEAASRRSGPALAEVLRSGRIWWIAVVGALYYMPVNVFGGLWGQRELAVDHGLGPVEAETAVSMVFWGMALGSVLGGWLSDHVGHRKWIVAASSILCAAAYSLVVFSGVSSAAWISAILFLAGLLGGPQMLIFAMAKEGKPMRLTGTVVAFVNMIGIGSALVFQPLVGVLLDATGQFQLALAALPACLVAAAVLTAFVSEQRHSDHA